MRYDPNYVSLLSASISSSSLQEQKLTGELSSGLRVQKLSDDAVAASSNVLLQSSVSRIDAFTTAAGTNESLLQVTDSTLGEVVSQITSAISLSVDAGNETLNAANRGALAVQVQGIRDHVLTLANTSYQGNYLFSGSAGTTPPFSIDSTTNPATSTYSGDNVVRSATTPDGQQIQLNLPGSQIFSASGSDLLAGLNQLVSDLNAGNTSAVAGDSSSLTAALGTVSAQRSVLGSSLSRLQATSSYENTQQTIYRAAQSSLLSADTAQVATGLKNAEVQHEALLSVVATVGKTNLFDYLK